MKTLDEPVRRSRKISLTPMIDIVFLLLIFFMLISTIGGTQVLRFATPSGERKSTEADFKLSPVFILGDNTIKISGQIVAPDDLDAEISNLKSQAAEITLMIVVEPGAKNQSLIYVIEAARNAGIKNISMKKLKDAQALLPAGDNGAEQ